MRVGIKTRVGLLAAMASSVLLGVLPADASTGVATFSGTGTISPGLALNPTAQTFTVSGSGVVVTGTAVGRYACAVTGNDRIGTVAQGAGSFSGNCAVSDVAGGDCPFTVGGSFTRTSDVLSVSGTASGCVSGSFTGSCPFVPTSAPTVSSFAIEPSCLFVIT